MAIKSQQPSQATWSPFFCSFKDQQLHIRLRSRITFNGMITAMELRGWHWALRTLRECVATWHEGFFWKGVCLIHWLLKDVKRHLLPFTSFTSDLFKCCIYPIILMHFACSHCFFEDTCPSLEKLVWHTETTIKSLESLCQTSKPRNLLTAQAREGIGNRWK